MRQHIVLIILGMAVVTYLTRAPLLLALSRRPPGPRLRLWLRLVPLAVLPALALPMVVAPHGRLALSWSSPEIWGAATVFACAAARLNLLLSVAAAVGVVAGLRQLAP
jgi:branched-subunit amino acid transport protein